MAVLFQVNVLFLGKQRDELGLIHDYSVAIRSYREHDCPGGLLVDIVGRDDELAARPGDGNAPNLVVKLADPTGRGLFDNQRAENSSKLTRICDMVDAAKDIL